MRIAFLGASLTEGKYGGNFVAAAQDALPEHTLLNHGVSGQTINKMLERVPDVLADEPDAVFVLPGSNDALAYVFPLTRPYYKSQQGLPEGFIEPATYAALFRDLCQAFMLEHIEVWVGLPPMEHNPAAVEAATVFREETRAVAEALGLPVLDLDARLSPATVPDRPALDMSVLFRIGDRMKSGWDDYEPERAEGGYTYSFDGTHFTPETAATVGRWLAEWIHEQAG